MREWVRQPFLPEEPATRLELFFVDRVVAATGVLVEREVNPENDKLNVNDWVIASDHPMGATGAIIVMTLLDEFEQSDLQRSTAAVPGAAG